MEFFLIPSMVLGLLDQLQTFWQLYLIELLRTSGAIRAVALNMPKDFDRVWHVVLLQKLNSYGISGRICGLILLFLVIGSFEWFRMGSLHKNIQLMPKFLKTLFLVLHFSYYTLMIFLMMLSVILLSMLMILLSILSVIRHLICGNN